VRVLICLPRGSEDDIASGARACLEALISVNLDLLRRFPKIPSLYGSGVRFQAEPPAWKVEHFDHIGRVLERGWGDCDDLVGWRCAELRFGGELGAAPRIIWPRGQRRYHGQVRRADGTVEDPSHGLRRMNGL
jgi:hypothetical protein